MKYLFSLFLFVLTVTAQRPMDEKPFPPPSYAYMAAQSGTLQGKEIRIKYDEYTQMGCTYIGMTRFGDQKQYASLWCVKVELFLN